MYHVLNTHFKYSLENTSLIQFTVRENNIIAILSEVNGCLFRIPGTCPSPQVRSRTDKHQIIRATVLYATYASIPWTTDL